MRQGGGEQKRGEMKFVCMQEGFYSHAAFTASIKHYEQFHLTWLNGRQDKLTTANVISLIIHTSDTFNIQFSIVIDDRDTLK